jgi:hypothetical protein
MKLTEQEKAILADIRLLESQRVKDDLAFQVGLMKRTQDALKADYGLIGPNAPLFNGIAGIDRNPAPMGIDGAVVNA